MTALAATVAVAALAGNVYALATRDDSAARARNALGGDLLTQDEVRGLQGGQGGEIRGPDGTVIIIEDDGTVRTATRDGATRRIGTARLGEAVLRL